MTATAIRNYLARYQRSRIDLKAVLFDMDGVLYDSMSNHTLAWKQAMDEMHLETDRDEFYLHEGRTGAGTIDLFFRRFFGRPATEEEKEQIYTRKSAYFNQMPIPAVMPGSRELLAQVQEAGLRPVLVTGSGQRSLLEKLEHDFPGVFEAGYTVTAFDVKQGKPNPEPYLKGLQKAGIAPFEAFVVENAPLGVQAAAAAGIFTVAVRTGPVPETVLAESGADLQYPSMIALSDDFPNLTGLFRCITQSV